jgi:hypothetical protein
VVERLLESSHGGWRSGLGGCTEQDAATFVEDSKAPEFVGIRALGQACHVGNPVEVECTCHCALGQNWVGSG